MCILWLITCSPERDNPYDPNSPSYQGKTFLQGTCRNRILVLLPSAKISLRSLKGSTHLFTFTDEQGRYELRNCPVESVRVIAEKEGFAAESTDLFLLAYKAETLDFVLEGLPKFLSAAVFSYYGQRHIPYDSIALSLECKIKDEEGPGDISDVFGIIEGLSDTLPLFFKSGFSYENTFPEESLSKGLDEITGRDIHIVAQDRFGNEVKSSALRLVRVIRQPPEPVAPVGGSNVSPPVVLVWRSPPYLFSHSLFCEVYRISPNLPPILFRRYENILAGDTSLTLSVPLDTGFYYWQIGVRDDYHNCAKSAEAVFKVAAKTASRPIQ